MKNTESFILASGGRTHTSETVNPTSYTRQHMHSQVKHFQQLSSNLTQTDKILHEHFYSDQYYQINSIANPQLKDSKLKSQVSCKTDITY